MAHDKISFEIFPIFNQSADAQTWSDFVRLETTCDAQKYNYSIDDMIINETIKGHMENWKKYKYNFAFGAYYDGKMIGFVSGYLYGTKETYLRNLYVLPQYNGCGVGTRLLNSAEKTATIMASEMSLVSLPGAVSFYERNGYRNFDNSHMIKTMSPFVIGVVPVFQWMKGGIRAKFNVNVDNAVFRKNKYQPIFVYMDGNNKIDGVAIRTIDGEDVVWVNESRPQIESVFYRKELLRALSKVR